MIKSYDMLTVYARLHNGDEYEFPFDFGETQEYTTAIEQFICLLEEDIHDIFVRINGAYYPVGTLFDFTRDFIIQALEKCQWRQKDAAKMLGISPRVMCYSIKKYKINPPHEVDWWRVNKPKD